MLKRLVVAFVLLPVLTISCAPFSAPAHGTPAPDFELFGFDNRVVRLSDYLGRPVVINFWGTQCIYCLEEMPDLEDAFRQESEKIDGAIFLAVNVQDTAATARTFMNNHGYTIPVLMDAGGRAARAYNVSAIPVTFIVDRTGIIRYVKLGMFLNLGEINAALELVR